MVQTLVWYLRRLHSLKLLSPEPSASPATVALAIAPMGYVNSKRTAKRIPEKVPGWLRHREHRRHVAPREVHECSLPQPRGACAGCAAVVPWFTAWKSSEPADTAALLLLVGKTFSASRTQCVADAALLDRSCSVLSPGSCVQPGWASTAALALPMGTAPGPGAVARPGIAGN